MKSQHFDYFVGKKNGCIYRSLGGGKYQNITTGNSGEIDSEMAEKMLQNSKELSGILSENPLIEKLISDLKMIKK